MFAAPHCESAASGPVLMKDACADCAVGGRGTSLRSETALVVEALESGLWVLRADTEVLERCLEVVMLGGIALQRRDDGGAGPGNGDVANAQAVVVSEKRARRRGRVYAIGRARMAREWAWWVVTAAVMVEVYFARCLPTPVAGQQQTQLAGWCAGRARSPPPHPDSTSHLTPYSIILSY